MDIKFIVAIFVTAILVIGAGVGVYLSMYFSKDSTNLLGDSSTPSTSSPALTTTSTTSTMLDNINGIITKYNGIDSIMLTIQENIDMGSNFAVVPPEGIEISTEETAMGVLILHINGMKPHVSYDLIDPDNDDTTPIITIPSIPHSFIYLDASSEGIIDKNEDETDAATTAAPETETTETSSEVTITIGKQINLTPEATNVASDAIADDQPVTWSIEPTLPSGLKFDSTSGKIFGILIPTTSTSSNSSEQSMHSLVFTITASNPRGKTASILTLNAQSMKAIVSPPHDIVYETMSLRIQQFDETMEDLIVILLPSTSNHGPIEYFTIAPQLPDGLTLNSKTGTISGVPLEPTLGSKGFVVSAHNSGGQSDTSIELNVLISLEYTSMDMMYEEGSYITENKINPSKLNSLSNDEVAFVISPKLPLGLTLDTNTGTISGVPLMKKSAKIYNVNAVSVESAEILGEAKLTIQVKIATTMYWVGISPIDISSNINPSSTAYFKDDTAYVKDPDASTVHTVESQVNINKDLLPIGVASTYREGKSIEYNLPTLSAGFWKVKLHFMEYDDSVKEGDRIMNVYIDDTLFIKDLDIMKIAGTTLSTITEELTVLSNNGNLKIVVECGITGARAIIVGIEFGPATRLNKLNSSIQSLSFDSNSGITTQGVVFSLDKTPSVPLSTVTNAYIVCVEGCQDQVAEKESQQEQQEQDQDDTEVASVDDDPTDVLDNDANIEAVTANNWEVSDYFSNIDLSLSDPSMSLTVKYTGPGLSNEVALLYVTGRNLIPSVVLLKFNKLLDGQFNLEAGIQPTLKAMGPPVKVDYNFQEATILNNPTALAIGPDGRLYVSSMNGDIHHFHVSEDFQLSDEQTISVAAKEILGITFDPFADKPTLYISASNKFYAAGGGCFTGVDMGYPGMIYRLTKTNPLSNYWMEEVVVMNLPVSNHDHGINQMAFDVHGDLFVAVGGNTNAGVAGNCKAGSIPENPFSGAILRIPLSTNLNLRTIQYYTDDGTLNMSAWDGDKVQAGGTDIEVFSPGHRNAFGCTYTKLDLLYCSDNGPNKPFGVMSIGPGTEGGTISVGDDELNLVCEGCYFGSPNRNRAKYSNDPDQNIYVDAKTASSGNYNAPLSLLDSAQAGLAASTSRVFNGAIQGALLTQKYKGDVTAIILTKDGTKVVDKFKIDGSGGNGELDVIQFPGGAIFNAGFKSDTIIVGIPQDVASKSEMDALVYDIFPYQGISTGGGTFVIAGMNLGPKNQVFINGVECEITHETSKRIHGIIPSLASVDLEMEATTTASPWYDVTVMTWYDAKTGIQVTMEEAYRFLPASIRN